jgi:hypothetical protein
MFESQKKENVLFVGNILTPMMTQQDQTNENRLYAFGIGIWGVGSDSW